MAARFWVGGTGPWNSTSTANWSATSGGAAGASAPTSGDNVTFDANSGTGTCTADATATCSQCTFGTATVPLVFSGSATFADNLIFTLGAIDLGGNTFTLGRITSNVSNTRSIAFGATGVINLTVSGTSVLNFATATGLSCTGSRTVNLTYSGSVGTRSVSFGNTAGATESNVLDVNITAGTDTVSIGAGSSFRNRDDTGFAGTLSNAAVTIYGSRTFAAGATYSAGTGTLTMGATSGVKTITTAGKTLDFPISINAPGATVRFADALTQGSTRAFTLTAGTLELKEGVTSTVGAFATSGGTAKNLRSALSGSRATLSQASGTVNVSGLTIRDIATAGGATFNALVTAGNVDAGNNLGWNFAAGLYGPSGMDRGRLRLGL